MRVCNRVCNTVHWRRSLWLAGAAIAAATLLLLPPTDHTATANGPGPLPTPLPLIVVQVAPTPAPVVGPRLNPEPIPHTDVLLPLVIQDQLLSPPPQSAQEANAAADAIREGQESDGRGITTAVSPIASGLTLFAPRTVLQVTYLAVTAGHCRTGSHRRTRCAGRGGPCGHHRARPVLCATQRSGPHSGATSADCAGAACGPGAACWHSAPSAGRRAAHNPITGATGVA